MTGDCISIFELNTIKIVIIFQRLSQQERMILVAMDYLDSDAAGSGSGSAQDDGVITRENFENLPSTYARQYYQQYAPYNNQSLSSSSTADVPKDEILQKMNHIIQMLEDQQDEKTGNVTEELILYCFLGVFVIFVVDSFARAGKYVR